MGTCYRLHVFIARDTDNASVFDAVRGGRGYALASFDLFKDYETAIALIDERIGAFELGEAWTGAAVPEYFKAAAVRVTPGAEALANMPPDDRPWCMAALAVVIAHARDTEGMGLDRTWLVVERDQ